jgi:hypothetical protein
MNLKLQSTDEMGEIIVGDVAVPCRIWRGESDRGVPCLVFVTRIAVDDRYVAEFEAELADVTAITHTQTRLDL